MLDSMIDRIIGTYYRMSASVQTPREQARVRLATYVEMLMDGGQRDSERLMVLGLAYLRELDGRSDPVRDGYTGM